MKTDSKSYEKIWQRFVSVDQHLLQIEAKLPVNHVTAQESHNVKLDELFRERLRMVPNMASGQYFILQLIHRFGFDTTEIASWCNLSPLMVFNIARSKDKKWSSSTVFERLLRFYCVVLRHNLQPAQRSVVH